MKKLIKSIMTSAGDFWESHRNLIGLIMIFAGIILGLYVSIWVCFIGGIVQVINIIKSPEAVEALAIALAIARIVLAGLGFWISALILVIPGFTLWED